MSADCRVGGLSCRRIVTPRRIVCRRIVGIRLFIHYNLENFSTEALILNQKLQLLLLVEAVNSQEPQLLQSGSLVY